MKKKIASLLSLCLIFTTLYSCKNDEPQQSDINNVEEEQTHEEETPVIEDDNEEEEEQPIEEHVHNFQNLVSSDFLVANATIDNPAIYHKSCECGEISDETFEDGSPLQYELFGEPFEADYTSLFKEYDSEDIVKVAENIVCPTIINRFIGDSRKVTFKHYSFNYETTYLDSSRIVLSGSFIIPLFNGEPFINFVNIDSHVTLDYARQAPSIDFGIFDFLALAGGLVIACDLLGFGRTNSSPLDYHCYHLTGKNTADGVIAAISLIENELGISLKNYKFFNTGYSQGGYDSMAFLRYLETEASEEQRNAIQLTHSYCGSGAYDLSIMFEDALKNETFRAPEYILMGLISAYDFHPEIFGNHTIEDYLTNYGKRFIKPVLDKDYDQVKYLKSLVYSDGTKLYNGPKDFFTFNYENPDPELLEILNKFSKLETLVNGDWLPEGRLTLYYLPKDDLVSPRSSLKALETFKGLENVDSMTGYFSDHAVGTVFYYIEIADLIMKEIK